MQLDIDGKGEESKRDGIGSNNGAVRASARVPGSLSQSCPPEESPVLQEQASTSNWAV